IQLADYLANGCPDTDFNKQLAGLLGKPVLLGLWIGIVRVIAQLQQAGVFPPFVPQLPAFYFEPNSTTLTPAAYIFDTRLVEARNDAAHPGTTASDPTLSSRVQA